MMSPHRRSRRRCLGSPAGASGAGTTFELSLQHMLRCLPGRYCVCDERLRAGVAWAPFGHGMACQEHAALRGRATLIVYALVAPIARGGGGRELRYSLPSFTRG